jgi:uncharacterized protein YgbK (DUF1537 family)
MPLRFTKTKAVLSGHCSVEEAEQILEWLTKNPRGELNLAEVTHFHAAALQAVAATGNRIGTAPKDAFCAGLLRQLGRV